MQDFLHDRVIYAIVIEDEVVYIGICESQSTTLKARMNRYQSNAGSGRNEESTKMIKKCLQEKKSVEIFALKPSGFLHYNEIGVDLVKGLENPMIAQIKPRWNKRL